LLSYYTAYLRCYYAPEWLAACIQIDRLDEDKLAILLRECNGDRIVVKEPNINESSIETSVNKQGQILLPLSSIKNVGSRADDIVNNQPYENLEDFATRARPNRLTVQSLAEACALECLEETHSFTYVEDFMVHWDSIVESRNAKEKLALRMRITLNTNLCYGENCYYGNDDAYGAVVAWIESDGHYHNLLDPGYYRIGVSGFWHSRYKKNYVQVFSGKKWMDYIW
jgi:hypothetical protein